MKEQFIILLQHAPMEKSATFSQRMTMHHNKQVINYYISLCWVHKNALDVHAHTQEFIE
jgi:hypothetical protein